jgi:Putative glycosyl hydrolase domain
MLGPRPLLGITAIALLVASGCVSGERPELAISTPTPTAPSPAATVTPVSTPTPVAPIALRGSVVSALDGSPLPGATLTSTTNTATTGADGTFILLTSIADHSITVERPTWKPLTFELPEKPEGLLAIEMEPFIVRALRVARGVAADPESFEALLALADQSVVNTLVFDTKDEEDTVLYETDVELANELGAVRPAYDPPELLAKARDHGLYTVTRIVTFEDQFWARGVPEAKLVGDWVNASDRSNWEYPLDLAVEACQLGFDEIQFDYVRFPASQLAKLAADHIPASSEERAAVIGGFLAEARSRLHPIGCGVSAAVFGIVMSSSHDERIGQVLEDVSASVDAVSPMLYPSHYSPGWLGFSDPNDHPGPVVAYSLDAGAGRVQTPTLVRPWIQGFYYNGTQVQAQIVEVEARGAGWIIWNVFGQYRASWLPTNPPAG